MNEKYERVDHAALRVNQAHIVGLLIVAFVLNAPWLVAFVALMMLGGTLLRQPGFKIVYTGFLKPRRLVKPDVIEDNPQPHLFAQGLGGSVLVAGLIAFGFGNAVIGWVLAWLVVALAALNLLVGFCSGCFVYYWLNRLNVPGFGAHPLPGVFPGMRPSRKAS